MWCNGIGWFANAWSSRRFLPLRLSPVRFTRGTPPPAAADLWAPTASPGPRVPAAKATSPSPPPLSPPDTAGPRPPPRFTSPARCMLGTARGVSTCPARGCCVVSLAIVTGERAPPRPRRGARGRVRWGSIRRSGRRPTVPPVPSLPAPPPVVRYLIARGPAVLAWHPPHPPPPPRQPEAEAKLS